MTRIILALLFLLISLPAHAQVKQMRGPFPVTIGGTGNKFYRLQTPKTLLARKVMATPPTATQGTASSYAAVVTGEVAGTVLTVTGVTSGTVRVGEKISGTGVTSGSVIVSLGTGTGGTGTYNLSASSTASSTTITCTSLSVTPTSQNAYGSNPANTSFTYAGYEPSIGVNETTGKNVTSTTTPTYVGQTTTISFEHFGSSFEIVQSGYSGHMLIKVNDEYTTLTPISVGASTSYYHVDFASIALRRIDIIGSYTALRAVNIGYNDTISAASIRGPRVIFLGDSFTSAAGATGVETEGYVRVFADLMGWDDVWASGVGGTGYLAKGASQYTFRERVAHDVIAYNPNIVWVTGSINDFAKTSSDIYTEAVALYSQLRTSLPNAMIIASPLASGGVSTLTTNALNVISAMKSAAAATGVTWIDFVEMPMVGTPISGTVYSTASAGAAQIYIRIAGTHKMIAGGETIILDAGTANEEKVKTLTANNAGDADGYHYYLATIDGTLQHDHAAGSTWTQVGRSLWTGHGNTGSLTGYGNSDYIVYSDAKHPTTLGHNVLGTAAATLFMRQLNSEQYQ